MKGYTNRVPDNNFQSCSNWEEALAIYEREYSLNKVKIIAPPAPQPGDTVNQPLEVSSRDPSPMPGTSSRPIHVLSSPANPIQRAAAIPVQ